MVMIGHDFRSLITRHEIVGFYIGRWLLNEVRGWRVGVGLHREARQGIVRAPDTDTTSQPHPLIQWVHS